MLLQVEEHNGHIFKSTQYSIPTYCEFCSSLIWMMDRACVCKREPVTVYSTNHTIVYVSEFYKRCMSVSLWGENTVQMMFFEVVDQQFRPLGSPQSYIRHSTIYPVSF